MAKATVERLAGPLLSKPGAVRPVALPRRFIIEDAVLNDTFRIR